MWIFRWRLYNFDYSIGGPKGNKPIVRIYIWCQKNPPLFLEHYINKEQN